MITRTLVIDRSAPQQEQIDIAASVVRSGGLVAFPTETVYGLGANALDARAVRRIFEVKGRPATNPLIVHVASIPDARALVADWPDMAQRLATRFWPGPLTLVLPKAAHIPDEVTASGATVAVRVPAHPVALALLRAVQVPIAAPSANRSAQLSPTQAAHVLNGLEGAIELVLDGGPTSGGIESTVVDLSGPRPTLLRPGLVTPAQIAAVIGDLGMAASESAGPLKSPGRLAKHYSPRTPLECVAGDGRVRVEQLLKAGMRVGWLCFSTNEIASESLCHVRMSSEAAGYAAELFARLHELDAARLDRIVATLPPNTADWLGPRDRLLRASAGTT